MIAYYVNSNGEKINLLKSPYRMVSADLFDSTWEEADSGFEKTVEIDVFGKKSEFKQNMERLYDIFAVDAEKGVCGRLYVNGSYLRCNLRKSKKDKWKGFVMSIVDMTLYAPALEWVQELEHSFYPQTETESTDGMDFEVDFPFDFNSGTRGIEQWNIDHVMPSDFQMIIYGPCQNPKVLINSYPYEVLASLDSGEYLVIDSADNSVTKYHSNGTTSNLFNVRGYEYSVFERIPSGLLTVNWPGDFGFDIILRIVRREPLW